MDTATIRGIVDGVQWAIILTAILILAATIEMGRQWKDMRPYFVLPVSLAVFSVVFYAFAFADVLTSPWVNLWSASLRLYSYVMVLGVLVAVIWARKRGDDDDE